MPKKKKRPVLLDVFLRVCPWCHLQHYEGEHFPYECDQNPRNQQEGAPVEDGIDPQDIITQGPFR